MIATSKSRNVKPRRKSVIADRSRRVEYRTADINDAAELADFAARMFTVSYEHVMDREELAGYVATNHTVDLKRAELRNPRFMTFLALSDHIVGYSQIIEVSLPDCPITAAKPAELKRIYVDPEWHGHGVAQTLLRLVEGEAVKRQCDVLWLAVWEINDRAIAFYRKSGFEPIGKQGFPIGNDVRSDFVMAKPLANELR